MIDVVAIDDDASICWLLGEVLALAGVAHRVTPSVASFLASVTEWLPPVALIDVSLAGSSGIEVARQVRAASPATEIVFLTGYGSGVAAKAGFACTVVEKPFDIDRLVELVLKNIALAKARAIQIGDAC